MTKLMRSHVKHLFGAITEGAISLYCSHFSLVSDASSVKSKDRERDLFIKDINLPKMREFEFALSHGV